MFIDNVNKLKQRIMDEFKGHPNKDVLVSADDINLFFEIPVNDAHKILEGLVNEGKLVKKGNDYSLAEIHK